MATALMFAPLARSRFQNAISESPPFPSPTWTTAPVGSYPVNATPDGVHDMLAYIIGEWCANGSRKERAIFTDHFSTSLTRMVGVFDDNRATPDLYFYSIGFRVARSIPANPR